MKAVLFVLTGILLVTMIVAVVYSVKLERDAQLRLDELSGELKRLERPTMNAEAQIAAVAKVGAQTAAKERDAFAAQQAYFESASARTDKLLDAATDTVWTIGTHSTLVLNDTDVSIKQFGAAAEQLGAAGTQVATDTHETLSAGKEMIQATTSDLSDPRIKDSFAHVDDATRDIAASAADVRTAAHFELNRLMKPVKKSWAFAQGAARVAGDFFHF